MIKRMVLEEGGGSWQNCRASKGGFDRVMEGPGRSRIVLGDTTVCVGGGWVLEGFERVLEGLLGCLGYWRVWKGLGGSGRVWKFFEVLEGSGPVEKDLGESRTL